MKVIKIFIYSFFILITIFSLKNLFNVEDYKPSFRILKDNIETQLASINYTAIELYYTQTCLTKTSEQIWSTEEERNVALSNFQTLFRLNSNLTELIANLITDPTMLQESLPELILSIFIPLIPILVLVFVTLFGWFICCSCCCYEYCPIVCKKKENEPYSTTSKLIPVILVVFSGLSLIIPAVMALNNFNSMFSTLESFYCTIINAEHTIGKGTELENQFPKWIGLEDRYYFQKLENMSWLDIDTKDTLDRDVEFEEKLNNLLNQFDSYTSLIDNFKYKKIVYPNIDNRDLSRKEYPDTIKSFYDTEGTSENFVTYLTKNIEGFSSIISAINDFKSRMTSLRNSKENISSLFSKFELSQTSTLNLLLINKTYESVFNQIISGTVTTVLNLVQQFLLFFQMFVAFLNITSSAFVIFNYKGAVGKYIGHSSWCLSSLNLTILSTVIFCLYAIGVFMINASEVQKEIMNMEALGNIIPGDNSSYISNFYINCLKEYNQTKLYEFYGHEEENVNLDEFVNHLFRMTVYTEQDVFKIIEVINRMQSEISNLLNPLKTITNVDPDDPNPFVTLQTLMNRVVDFRQSSPYQVFNDCGIPFSVEFFLSRTDCSYPQNTNPSIGAEQIKIGRICLIISEVSEADLERMFKRPLSKCKYTYGKFLESGFTSLYEELSNAHTIANAFYSEYVIYRNWFMDTILYDAADKYIKFAREAQEWINSVYSNYIGKLNNYFKFPLDQYAKKFATANIDNLEDFFNQKLFTLNKYISCNVYNEFLLQNIEFINFNIMNSMYKVIVCYMFLYVYNILSAIFGLMTILINYSDREEDSEKKNN